MREIVSGIFTWPWFSEPHGYNFNGHLVRHADEVFLTGTAAEITPIREIGPHHYQVGPLSRQLVEDYAKEVRG